MSASPAVSPSSKDNNYLVVDMNEMTTSAGDHAQPIYKLPVRARDGDVFAIALGATSVECLARAQKIAAVEAMISELEPTCTVLKTVATVLAQTGKMRAAMAIDDTFTRVLRVLGRARGGAA
jgi:hypothetical protein